MSDGYSWEQFGIDSDREIDKLKATIAALTAQRDRLLEICRAAITNIDGYIERDEFAAAIAEIEAQLKGEEDEQ